MTASEEATVSIIPNFGKQHTRSTIRGHVVENGIPNV